MKKFLAAVAASGLLLGISLCFLAMVPRIETRATGFRLLATVVVMGGLARLFSVAVQVMRT